MKKMFLLIAPLLLLSCSEDDSKPATTNESVFNPPAWIQGTWAKQESTATGQDYVFTFAGDNICSFSPNTNSTCWKEGIAELGNQNVDYVINENTTNTTYTVGYIANGIVVSVMFTKLADNKIDVFVPDGAAPQGVTGELVKQ